MVVVSKAERSIKVSNLPQDIANDVLGFIFPGYINVDRESFSTTAVVEFGSVRDVENYIRRDKTLMIENNVLGIEGCSAKIDGRSSSDPLESRQIYIENLPRSTTTEYLDVLFPFAKSIKRLDGFSALAEYRTAKDAEFEFTKSKNLRIDRHQLTVRMAKECHRSGGGHYNSHDRHEKGHSSSDRSSYSSADKSEKKKSLVDKNDLLFSGKEILSDLYGLPVEFGRSSHSRQRKEIIQDISLKKQAEKSTKKELPSNRATATSTSSSPSCSRSSKIDTGRNKNEGSESKRESGSHSSKESDAKSERYNPRSLEPQAYDRDKYYASPSCGTKETFGSNNRTAMASSNGKTLDKSKNPNNLPGMSGSSDYSTRSTSDTDRRRPSQHEYGSDRSKHSQIEPGNYSSDNRRRERPVRRNEERYKREHLTDRTGERRVRNFEDKRIYDRNPDGIDRERFNERDRPEEKRNDVLREDNRLADEMRSSRSASSERFGTRVDERGNQTLWGACNDVDKQWSGQRFDTRGSERSSYRDPSVFDERMHYRADAKDEGRSSSGEKGWFPLTVHQNKRWNKEDRKMDQGGQSRISNADCDIYDKDPLMDPGRFNGTPTMNQDSFERFQNKGHNMQQDRFGKSANTDQERFGQGFNVGQDKFNVGPKIDTGRFGKDQFMDPTDMNQERFPRGLNVDQRRFDRGSNMDQDRFNRGANMDQGRYDRNVNMDQGRYNRVPIMDQGRFDRGSNMDQGRFDGVPNMDQGRFDGVPSMDQGRFDRGPIMDQGKFDRGPNVDQERFVRGPNVDQERFVRGSNTSRGGFDRGSNMDRGSFDTMDQRMSISKDTYKNNRFDNSSLMNQNRFDRGPHNDQKRFEQVSSKEQNVFDAGSNQEQNKYYRGQNKDQGRFDRHLNMDQSRFERSQNIDQSKSGMGPNIEQNRFEIDPNIDQNRFDRCQNQDQNRFNMGQNMDQNRFGRSVNMDQRFNMNENRFDRGLGMAQNRFDKNPNMNRNRFEKDPNMDQNRFDGGPSIDQNRFNHGENVDQARFGHNANVTQLNKNWKSDDQRFGGNNIDRAEGFKGNFNVDPQQCWGRSNMDQLQSRREINPDRHFSCPEKRRFSAVDMDTQWKDNMAPRNFRHELQKGIDDGFPSKRPRNDGGYFNSDANSSCQNNQQMNSFPLHTAQLHLPPPLLSSSRHPMMQSSSMSIPPPNHLPPNRCF